MKIKKKKKHIEETFGEEIANFASHTAGAGLSIIALVILTIRASKKSCCNFFIYCV